MARLANSCWVTTVVKVPCKSCGKFVGGDTGEPVHVNPKDGYNEIQTYCARCCKLCAEPERKAAQG